MERALQQLGSVPATMSVLQSVLPPHRSFNAYVNRLERQGELLRIRKGLYVLSPRATGVAIEPYLAANHLYGPSYVSFQTALSHYGLIEDLTQAVQSATLSRSRQFESKLGHFTYTQLNSPYYSLGIRREQVGETAYLIATPEKALCDLIVTTPRLNIRYQTDLMHYLEDDLRFEVDAIKDFDISLLQQCAAAGKKKTALEQLLKLTLRYGRQPI